MNKYSIQDYLETQLSSYASSFKQTSLDTSNEQDKFLCQDESIRVYDFDQYVSENHPLDSLPPSPDAIYPGTKKVYFIEFKNSHASKINKGNIRAKFRSGTAILKDLLEGFAPRDLMFVFAVVYKKPAKPQYFDPTPIESNVIKFGLEEENKKLGGFYDEIITNNVDYYKDRFIGRVSC